MTAPADHHVHSATATGTAGPGDARSGGPGWESPGYADSGYADYDEGRVYHVAGGDWDEVVADAVSDERTSDERMVVNMGPQHPSTHGVLRLILTLDGETVTELRPVIGYLHTGIEKNMEFRTWTQGVTF